MEAQRPDPDALLKKIQAGAVSGKVQGKLKIFLGYAAGVGKTYAMLQAAHAAKAAGQDVVAGYIEPHGRTDTLALIEGLEVLPPLEIAYRGITLREFDLDAALRRHPELILVDELAHTNGENCRHRKRYQDVEELLKAGVSVYSTMNVQHIESLHDIVAAITGISMRERVPDSVLDLADQVELVDIEPANLVERLRQGKIYKERQAVRALENFFTPENLTALREVSLRNTADVLGKRAEKTLPPGHGYRAEEHILICLSSSPSNPKVIRTAARMAEAFHGDFTALFVEGSDYEGLDDADKKRLEDNTRLAEQLGARITTIYGDDVPARIAEYAALSSVSKLVIGRSGASPHKRVSPGGLFSPRGALVEKLVTLAPNLDIYIIPDQKNLDAPGDKAAGKTAGGSGSKGAHSRASFHPLGSSLRFALTLADAGKTLGILVLATLLGFLFDFQGVNEANIITMYIFGVLCVSMLTGGFFWGVSAAVASVLLFNFFFTAPRYTFNADESGYPLTFIFMLLSAILTSSLTYRIRAEAGQAAQKAYGMEILLQNSQRLQAAEGEEGIMAETATRLVQLLGCAVAFYPVRRNHILPPMVFNQDGLRLDGETPAVQDPDALTRLTGSNERAVAEWVMRNNKRAGTGTDTLPGARCLYMAVRGRDAVVGVAAMELAGRHPPSAMNKSLILSLLGECALALEKERFTRGAR